MANQPALKPIAQGELLTAKEAAALLKCHRSWITKLLQQQTISGFRLGRKLLVPRAEIERYLNENRI